MATVVGIGIVGGSDTNGCRDIAADVLNRLEHMFLYEIDQQTGGGLLIKSWDYRLDSPRVIPKGTLASRSLAMVHRSHGLIGHILRGSAGDHPRGSSRGLQAQRCRRSTGDWVFVGRDCKNSEHDRFFSAIEKEFGETIQWTPFASELDFQGKVFTTLLPFLMGTVISMVPVEGER
jgi:hypothetical protein